MAVLSEVLTIEGLPHPTIDTTRVGSSDIEERNGHRIGTSKEIFNLMQLFGPISAHRLARGVPTIFSTTCRSHRKWLIIRMVWNKNYYSCAVNPIYRGKEYYYVGSTSLASISSMQVNDVIYILGGWGNGGQSTTMWIPRPPPRPRPQPRPLPPPR
jgi:hypothetical protein